MDKKAKIFSIVLGVIVVFGIVLSFIDFCPVTLNSIVQEEIPKAWIDTFDADFKIVFEPYMELIELPNGGWVYDEDTRIEFSTEEQKIIKDMLYKAIYSMSRIDSYFEKKLPWTNGEAYYDWLKNSLDTINFTANPNSKVGGAAVYDMKTIYLDGYTLLDQAGDGALEAWSYQFPELLEKTGIVFTVNIVNHEVRHLNNIDHSSCRGSDNMDENLRMMGAHGVNIIVRHWITYLLPESMAEKALLENGDGLKYDGWVDRMCSLDLTTGELDEKDRQWMENISGYPLDYDRDVMWTVSY